MALDFNSLLRNAQYGLGWTVSPADVMLARGEDPSASQPSQDDIDIARYLSGVLADLDRQYGWSGWGMQPGRGPSPDEIQAWLTRVVTDPNAVPVSAIQALATNLAARRTDQGQAAYASLYGPYYGFGMPLTKWAQQHAGLAGGDPALALGDVGGGSNRLYWMRWLAGTLASGNESSGIPSPLAGQVTEWSDPATVRAAVNTAMQQVAQQDATPLSRERLQTLLTSPSITPADIQTITYEQWQQLPAPVQNALNARLQQVQGAWDAAHRDTDTFFGTPMGILWSLGAGTLTGGLIADALSGALSGTAAAAPASTAAPAAAGPLAEEALVPGAFTEAATTTAAPAAAATGGEGSLGTALLASVALQQAGSLLTSLLGPSPQAAMSAPMAPTGGPAGGSPVTQPTSPSAAQLASLSAQMSEPHRGLTPLFTSRMRGTQTAPLGTDPSFTLQYAV